MTTKIDIYIYNNTYNNDKKDDRNSLTKKKDRKRKKKKTQFTSQAERAAGLINKQRKVCPMVLIHKSLLETQRHFPVAGYNLR